jgi:uncharacterized protein YndB with AHSA1/START domain
MATTATMAGSLTLTRIFEAPVDLVWRCWTEKEHLEQWSAPRGYRIEQSEGDLRAGCKWHIVMRAPDGQALGLGGVYRQIVPYRLLVMTHVWDDDAGSGVESTVTVRFEDLGGRTRMTFEQTGFPSDESRKGHEQGWGECFDILAEHLVALKQKGSAS